MLVLALLLTLRKVATARVVDGRVAGLLALGEVAAVLLFRGFAFLLLAGREPAVRGLVVVVVVLAVVVMLAVVVVVTVIVIVIVGGMLAHVPWVSQRCV
jgi:hypothetical protein